MKNLKIVIIRLILIYAIPANSQNNHPPSPTLELEWRAIESQVNHGLILDAKEAILKILNKSRRENWQDQICKSYIYLAKISAIKNKIWEAGFIQQLETYLPELDEPYLSITKSIIAELYLTLPRNGEYEQLFGIIDQEIESDEDSSNVGYWNLSKLNKKAIEYLQSSIQNKKLNQYNTTDYRLLLEIGQDTIEQPTLLDIILSRAIKLYPKEYNRNKIFTKDILPDSSLLNPEFFIQADLSIYPQLTLYQELLKHKINSGNIAGLIETWLTLLTYDISNDFNFNLQYLNILYDSYENYKRYPYADHILLKIIDFYDHKVKYQKNANIETRVYAQKVDSLCYQILKQNRNTTCINEAKNILDELHLKDATFEIEKENLPNQNSKCLVKFRNTENLYFRLYKLTPEIYSKMINSWDNIETEYLKGKLIKTWEDAAPKTSDYLTHSIECKIDPLDVGLYCLVLSCTKEENPNSSISVQKFQITKLAVIQYNSSDYDNGIYVIDRETGSPIENVKIDLIHNKYGYGSEEEVSPISTLFTDTQGKVNLPNKFSGGCWLSQGEDQYLIEKDLHNYKNYLSDRKLDRYEVKFYTDRTLYRPGQKVHFKALTLKIDTNETPSIYKNGRLKINLLDVNNIIISSLELKSNSFGSAYGSFTIPHEKLLGQYTIESDYSEAYTEDEQNNNLDIHFYGDNRINVEEYKRPTFEIVFDTIQNSTNQNLEIVITGTIKTFNGIAVPNAKINYEINKKHYFLYNNLWQKKNYEDYYGSYSESSETISTSDGKFKIPFNPKNEREDIDFDNINYYQMVISATDGSGETQYNSISIPISNKKIFVKTQLDSFHFLNQLKKVNFSLQTIYETPIKKNVKILIQELELPTRFIRNRLWEKPEFYRYTYQEFKQLFPDDVYEDEDQKQHWKIKSTIYIDSIYNSDNLNIDLNKIQKAGAYKIQLNIETHNGQVDTWENYIIIIDEKSQNSYYLPTVLYENQNENQSSKIQFKALGISNDYNILCIYHSRSLLDISWKKIQNNSNISYPFSKTDNGGVYFTIAGTLKNRSFTNNIFLPLPWTEKKLDIKTKSFRSKLKPGQDETFSFQINQKNQDTSQLELLAAMYDASLDLITPFTWDTTFWPEFKSKERFYITQPNNEYSYYAQYIKSTHSFLQPTVFRDFISDPNGYTLVYNRTSSPNLHEEITNNNFTNKENRITLTNRLLTYSRINIRKNLNETVFFYPSIYKNSKGEYQFSFTMNEALTKWKLQLLAHSKDLDIAYKSEHVVTIKPIQIKPFYPRFLRQGDTITLFANVSNITTNHEQVKVNLKIFDQVTNRNVTKEFLTGSSNKKYKIEANTSKVVDWKLTIPKNQLSPLLLVYTVKGKDNTDGEENTIPIISNQKLINETMPLNVKADETKEFDFTSLKKIGHSSTAIPLRYTVEFTSHPIWYVVQSLPYLMNYPWDCNEQIASKIFANAASLHILNSNPRIAETLKKFDKNDSASTVFNRNQDLKSLTLEETPWLNFAKYEKSQLIELSTILDSTKNANALILNIQKLRSNQNFDGSWPWFQNGHTNKFITSYIGLILNQCEKLNIKDDVQYMLNGMIKSAQRFVAQNLEKEYQLLEKKINNEKSIWESDQLNEFIILSMYCNSFHLNNIEGNFKKVNEFYLTQIEKYWQSENIYLEALCALIAHRNGKKDLAILIINSLRQRSITHEELGMYWKSNYNLYWYDRPIETQAILIQAFAEIDPIQSEIEQMKTWLIKNKQTNHWSTTIATVSAINALTAYGSNYLNDTNHVKMYVGEKEIQIEKQDNSLGCISKQWSADKIKPEFSKIKISNPNQSISYGAAYYQYLEDMDKVEQFNDTGLKLEKQLFIKRDTNNTFFYEPIKDQGQIKLGDLVVTRFIITSDRNMEFLHLKAMRATGLEPIDQLSGYQSENKLKYYISQRDLATDYFIDYLPKGMHVIELHTRASFIGEFSEGISSLQCLYAPEFISHTKGIRIKIIE